jgi:Zn-dependent membrane protease YugP
MNILGLMLFWDPTYMLIMGITLIPTLWASFKVKSTFARYAKVGLGSGMSGAEAAAQVLRSANIRGVTIEPHQGFLSDHYDPRAKALRLSPDVYQGRSVAAVAVAAHEAGHAIQDDVGYAPLRLRSALVPVASIGDRLWFLPFLIGLFANLSGLVLLGIILLATTVLFQLVTLPTEFDASRRAKEALVAIGVTRGGEETVGVSKVLNAAAMTYLAAALASIIQLLYWISVARRN